MGRSLKKGPFIDGYLLKKVEVLNETEKKSLSKPGPAARPFFHNSSVTRLGYMTVVSTCRYM